MIVPVPYEVDLEKKAFIQYEDIYLSKENTLKAVQEGAYLDNTLREDLKKRYNISESEMYEAEIDFLIEHQTRLMENQK